MREGWRRLAATLDGRTLRERVLIFAAGGALLLTAAYQLALGPVLAQWRELRGDTERIRAEAAELRAERARLEGSALQAERAELESRQEGLAGRLREQREGLREQVGSFIRPSRLMGFFEELLGTRTIGNCEVKRVTALEREERSFGGSDGGKAPPVTLVRKGVEVVVEADFPNALRFLKEVEELPWAVQVTTLDYEVTEYPRARMKLKAHTFLLGTGEAGNAG